MRTTINISEHIIKEAEALYKSNNRSKVIENALIDAIRYKNSKIQTIKREDKLR